YGICGILGIAIRTAIPLFPKRMLTKRRTSDFLAVKSPSSLPGGGGLGCCKHIRRRNITEFRKALRSAKNDSRLIKWGSRKAAIFAED
ncbi:MAG: hypothetical protein WCG81_18435, partial [Candidatus Angelobacter sp.]